MDNAEASNIEGVARDALLRLYVDSHVPIGAFLITDSAWVSPFPERAAWIDNYISLVGYPSGKAVNVCLTQSARFMETLGAIVIGMHGYAHEWYRASISQPQATLLGHRYSYERLGDAAGFSGSYPFPAGTWFEQASTANQLSLRRLSDNEALICQNQILGATPQAIGSRLASIVGNTVQTVGRVSASVIQKTEGYVEEALIATGDLILRNVPRIRLTTGPVALFPLRQMAGQGGSDTTNVPAYAWFTVLIPEDAERMSFDFTLSGEAQEDHLTFAINGTNQFNLAARFIPANALQNSGYIDISSLAGKTVEFFLGVTGGTSTNASIAVDGLRFYTVAKPTLTAQRIGPQLVLSWPLAASDYVLETSPTLSFSNVWTVVTNVASVADFQFSVTNNYQGNAGFFRLRKP